MFELFLAICALTALDCDSIYVRYGNTGAFDNIAIAGIGESGAYHIIMNNDTRRKSGSFKKQILVHEIAHLLVYEVDDTYTSHGELFQEACHWLAEEADLHPRTHNEVCDSHTASNSVWKSKRRRRE